MHNYKGIFETTWILKYLTMKPDDAVSTSWSLLTAAINVLKYD